MFAIAPTTTGSNFRALDTIPVSTIAILKSLTGMRNGQQAMVSGYYSAGDGGGGEFYWDAASSATDNGGTVIAADAGGVGRWRWIDPVGLISVKRFGAKGDGVTDDTAALNAAITAIAGNGGAVYFPEGSYKISSTLLLTATGTTLKGPNGTALWNGLVTVYEGGARIVKAAAMTTEAIKSRALGLTLQNIAILGEAGNTSDGIYLEDGFSARLVNVAVAKMGGVGIRIGAKTGQSGNVNGWQLTNVTSQYNGSHGLYLHDETAVGGPNANAGTASGLVTSGNTGDGVRVGKARYNTFSGLLSEGNTGYGVNLIGDAGLPLDITFIGGDIETNTAGNWNVGANARDIQYFSGEDASFTADPQTKRVAVITGNRALLKSIQFDTAGNGSALDAYRLGTFTPTLVGSGTAGTQTYTNQVGRYTRIGNRVFFNIYVSISAKDAAMAGGVRIGGLPLSASGVTGNYAAIAVGEYNGVNLSAGYTQVGGYVLPGTTTIAITELGDNVGAQDLPVAALAASSWFMVSGHYELP